jgi:Glycosyl hydrolase family 9
MHACLPALPLRAALIAAHALLRSTACVARAAPSAPAAVPLPHPDRTSACRKSRDDRTYLFVSDRNNPYDVNGAIVGGPKSDDSFIDDREAFQYTEIALDFNAGLTLGLAGARPPRLLLLIVMYVSQGGCGCSTGMACWPICVACTRADSSSSVCMEFAPRRGWQTSLRLCRQGDMLLCLQVCARSPRAPGLLTAATCCPVTTGQALRSTTKTRPHIREQTSYDEAGSTGRARAPLLDA